MLSFQRLDVYQRAIEFLSLVCEVSRDLVTIYTICVGPATSALGDIAHDRLRGSGQLVYGVGVPSRHVGDHVAVAVNVVDHVADHAHANVRCNFRHRPAWISAREFLSRRCH
jgi:hypothetical protein